MAPAISTASMGRRNGKPGCGLFDIRCYIAERSNSTTAVSKTSTGLTISVSFCAARPPALSQVSVHCPGLQLDEEAMPAWVICSDADLILLRVPLDPAGRIIQTCCDYFVYRMHPQHPKLDLLPNPRPTRLGDDDIGILSLGDGRYVVAGLKILPSTRRQHIFVLHMYRSTDDSGDNSSPGHWTTQRLSVEEPLRDWVCPIPDKAEIQIYHTTNDVIILRGENGYIGWVDLWRGILLCDVLSETPKLRDIPLPAPAKGNRTKFLNFCPHFFRNIVVNQSRDTIKYVELETTLPRKVSNSSRSGPISFYEWVRSHHRDQECPKSYTLVPGRWTATTYSMPIPVASWDGWRRDCSVCLDDIKLPIGNSRHCKLLCRLMGTKEQQEATKATLPLGLVSMAYPALTADGDDTIYMLSKGRTGLEAVIAVDAREGTVQGVAKLHTQRHTKFQRCFLATEVSKHVNITGTRASCGQAKEDEHMQQDHNKLKSWKVEGLRTDEMSAQLEHEVGVLEKVALYLNQQGWMDGKDNWLTVA